MKEKDKVKEVLLKRLNDIIDNKDKYSANKVERAEFLKDNIDEVVSVVMAGIASSIAGLNEEFKSALKRADNKEANKIKDRVMQEIYESYGFEEKLPTLQERDVMLHKHMEDLMEDYQNGQISKELIDHYNQWGLDLFNCKRGELDKQFADEDKLNIIITKDIDEKYAKSIEKVKESHQVEAKKVKSKK